MWYKSYKYVTNLTVNETRSAHTSCRCASAARLCGFSRVTQQQQSCANFTMRRHNHDSLERPVVQHASLGSSNDPFPHHQQPKLQGEKKCDFNGETKCHEDQDVCFSDSGLQNLASTNTLYCAELRWAEKSRVTCYSVSVWDPVNLFLCPLLKQE